MNVPVVGQLVGESARRFGHLITAAGPRDLPLALQRVLAAPPPPTHDAVARYGWSHGGAELRAALAEACEGRGACR